MLLERERERERERAFAKKVVRWFDASSSLFIAFRKKGRIPRLAS